MFSCEFSEIFKTTSGRLLPHYGRELHQNTHEYTVHSIYRLSAPYCLWNQTLVKFINSTENSTFIRNCVGGMGWVPLIFFEKAEHAKAVLGTQVHLGTFKNYVTQNFLSLTYCNLLIYTNVYVYQGVTLC